MALLFFLASNYNSFGIDISSADSLFKSANKQYGNGNLEDARKGYEILLQSGYSSGDVYYNLGNVYYKLRNYPHAILNYERALLLRPDDSDIKFNLAKARVYNLDKIDEIPEFIVKTWFNSLINMATSNVWAIASLVAFILFIAFLLVYLLSIRLSLKKAGFYLAIFMLTGSVSTFTFSSYALKNQTARNTAIIMTSTVTVKSSPSNSGNSLFIVHEGTKVELVGYLDDWYEIRLSDGKQGWLSENDLEKI